MIDERFVFLAAALNMLGAASYLIGTVRGTVSPNRVTWFIWAAAPLIAFAAMMQEGVGLPALMTFMVGFNPLLIFLASFINKHAVWRLGRLDIICGLLSLAGLGLWFVTREGDVAIVFGIFADALAAVPTIVKAYREPSTEDPKLYLLSSMSAGITMLTLKTWDVATAGFPGYILAVSAFIFALLRFNKPLQGIVGAREDRPGR